jgi:PhzF family phenazine biosynthesis protein
MSPPHRRSASEISFELYDSFATRRFGGNVAGVVLLKRWLPASVMQRIARELGAATTGFALLTATGLSPIRFFTPQQEIDACGRTVAIATALVERGVWQLTSDCEPVPVTTPGGSGSPSPGSREA